MHPTIYLFGLELDAYRLMTGVAVVAAVALTASLARRDGLRWRLTVALVLATVAGALAGARLFVATTADEPFVGDAGRLFALRFGDMAMFGGIGGAVIAGLAVARWSGERPERLADLAAPAVALSIVLLRIGCLLAGCCFGKETDLPWAITYPEDSLAHLHQRVDSVFSLFGAPQPVHPIPVYEMIVGAVLLIVAMWLRRRPVRAGTSFAVVVGGYALARIMIQPMRAPEPGSTPAWFDLVMFAAVALAIVVWLAAPHLRVDRFATRPRRRGATSDMAF